MKIPPEIFPPVSVQSSFSPGNDGQTKWIKTGTCKLTTRNYEGFAERGMGAQCRKLRIFSANKDQ